MSNKSAKAKFAEVDYGYRLYVDGRLADERYEIATEQKADADAKAALRYRFDVAKVQTPMYVEVFRFGEMGLKVLRRYFKIINNGSATLNYSRPGAKAAMGKFNSGDTVVVPYGREMVRGKIVRYDEPGMFYVVDIGKYESIKVAKEDVRKASMSRPGAKAKMAIRSDNDIFDVLTEASDKGLDRHNLVREARRLRDAIDPHGVGGQAMLKHKSWPQLVRLAEQIERLPAAYARPGAKAAFAAPGIVVKEDAQYIYYYPDEDDRATFADDDGKGAYTVKSNRTGKPVSTKTYRSWEEAVRASNAINEKLPPLKKRKASMSRPGAKAKMSKATDALEYIKNSIASGKIVYVTAGNRTTKVTPQAYAKWEASGKPLFKISSDGALLMASGSSYVRLTLADEMLARVTAMSRPGAKVTAGRAEDLYRQLSSGSITYANAKQWERLVTEALRLPDYTPPGGDMSLHEIAEDLGGDLMALKTHSGPVPHAKAKAEKASDLEREDVKAGLKLMEKADKAVSDKIRTLIAEGKPQDQAVAIALDMKRRGEI